MLSPRDAVFSQLQTSMGRAPVNLAPSAPKPQAAPQVPQPLRPQSAPMMARSTPRVVATGATLLSVGLSYQRNKSVPWAIVHGLIAPFYLAYRGVQAVSENA